jgi:hypothetical protein
LCLQSLTGYPSYKKYDLIILTKQKKMSIVVSSSLWGNKCKYTQGALLTARQIRLYNQSNRQPKLAFWVYHDDTVPKAVMARLRKDGAQCIQAPDWKGERRALWRFLALGKAYAVVTLDVDDNICHTLLTDRFCMRMLRGLAWARYEKRPGVWLWKAWWQHHGKSYIPAGLFGVCVTKPLGLKLQHDIEAYLSRTATLSTQGRYGNGYGLDEDYLTNFLIRQLRNTHKCQIHATGINNKHHCGTRC